MSASTPEELVGAIPGSPVPVGHAPEEHHPRLAHHFDDLAQQRESATLGMWTFLVTEIMIFGGLFTAYAVYRWHYPAEYAAASEHLMWKIATLNTVILLSSSFTVVLAVQAAELGNNRWIAIHLALTIVLGVAFLALKFYEYSVEYHEGLIPLPGLFDAANFPGHENDPLFLAHVKQFMCLYFLMTGLHAIHMLIGLGLLVWLIRLATKDYFLAEYHPQVELTGLYWHLVDVIWIFIFPLLYLTGHP